MNQPLSSPFLNDPRYAAYFKSRLNNESFVLLTSDEEPCRQFEHSQSKD